MNIIGNGTIAQALKDIDRPDLLFFASGVSNSQEQRESEYQREVDLMLFQDSSAHLVYFSSLAVFYSESRYAVHKRRMEQLIQHRFKKWTIMRLGVALWGDNPFTIVNYFRSRLAQGTPLKILDVERYLVAKDEFLHWVGLIPDFNCEMNITGIRVSAQKIAEAIKAGKL